MVRANGLVKILDFGIAKLSAPATTDEEAATAIQSTSPGMVIGTANYMSPEQAKGRDIDARTDIFSFGVVLYELIAGHQPFEGENGLEMIGAILKDEPKPLHADVPAEIQKIIGKCLRKDRDERYQTIRDVGNDLKEVKQELEVRNLMGRSLVPSEDENKTQILPATTADEKNRTTNQTVVTNPKTKYLAIGLLIMLLAGGGFFGYKYLSPTNKQIESIAVMPFVNESGNSEVEYLSDGMTETLIKSLSQLPNLAVKSRSTVFYYKGKESSPKKIGEELNVQAVLLGRVGGRGGNLKLNLELVNTTTQDVIWSEQYDRKQSDLVSLQSEIARDVSSNIKTKLSGAD
jgi:TolB-like protein